MGRMKRLYRRMSMAALATVVVVVAAVEFFEGSWDERTTAELEFDAWVQRRDLADRVHSRRCLEDRPRASDGRVPCGVVWTEGGPEPRSTVWCPSDETAAAGCLWR